MKTTFKSIALITIGVSSAILLSGCSAKGPQFSEMQKVEKDKSLIYIYRPSSFVGGGVSYDVHAKKSDGTDEIIGNLKNGGYLQYKTKPTEIEFWAKTESTSSVTLDVQANTMYCIKGEVGIGIIVGRPHLSIVDNALCTQEIKATALCID
ncbi:MAG: DUF2846 domain-containing protein [Sulfurovum sp.]|nr:DUF2846 domain-containing protein [Sulfurovum sp.]